MPWELLSFPIQRDFQYIYNIKIKMIYYRYQLNPFWLVNLWPLIQQSIFKHLNFFNILSIIFFSLFLQIFFLILILVVLLSQLYLNLILINFLIFFFFFLDNIHRLVELEDNLNMIFFEEIIWYIVVLFQMIQV